MDDNVKDLADAYTEYERNSLVIGSNTFELSVARIKVKGTSPCRTILASGTTNLLVNEVVLQFPILVRQQDSITGSTIVIPTHIFKDKNNNLYSIEGQLDQDNASDEDYIKVRGTANITVLQRVLTESEYSALGETSTDNVLYFVTPD